MVLHELNEGTPVRGAYIVLNHHSNLTALELHLVLQNKLLGVHPSITNGMNAMPSLKFDGIANQMA